MGLMWRKLGQPADGGKPLDLARGDAALARQQVEQQALADAVATYQGATRRGQGKGKGCSAGAKGQLQGVDMTCDMGHLNSCGPAGTAGQEPSQMTGTRIHGWENKRRSWHQPVTSRRTRSPWRERNQKRGADRLNAHRRKYSYIKGATRLTRHTRVSQPPRQTTSSVVTARRSGKITAIGLLLGMIGNKKPSRPGWFVLDGSQGSGPLTNAPGEDAGFATPPWRSGWP
ncbi:hypothetical protein D3C71_971830 [compost metagenome]